MAKKEATMEDGAEQATAVEQAPANLEPLKCPYCASTIWQGPFQRGPIIGKAMVVREVLYQCMGCNQVMDLPKIERGAV